MFYKVIGRIVPQISSSTIRRIMSPVSSPSKATPPPSLLSPSTSVPFTWGEPSSPKKNVSVKSRPFLTISVDGNISSGKSTLVSTLLEVLPKDFNYGVETMPEPLEKWTNVGGHNLLEMLYQDTTKNNFIFQHYVQLTRLSDTLQNCDPPELGQLGRIRVMERSIQNNRYCFSELARRQGTLHEAEFSVIAEWYKWLEEHCQLPLDLVIYLKTSPEVVYERMTSRGRSEESSVPLKYLSDLHETYEDWLIRGKIDEEDSMIPRKYEVLVVDANKSREEVAEECRELIKEFLAKKRSVGEGEDKEKGEEMEPSPVKRQKLNEKEETPE